MPHSAILPSMTLDDQERNSILAKGAGFDAQLGPFGQNISALATTNSVRFLVPSAVSLLILIIMIFYPLRKYFPEIAEMKEHMKAKEAIHK